MSKPKKIKGDIEADYREKWFKKLEGRIKVGSVSTLDGGTMWLGGGGGGTYSSTMGTSATTWATATGSGWSGGTATLYPSGTVTSAATTFRMLPILTDEQRAMVNEVICNELVKFGPGTPKPLVATGGLISGATVDWSFTYDET